MIKKLKYFFLSLLITITFVSVSAQNKDFSKVENIVSIKPASFHAIDSIMGKTKYDTIQMLRLLKLSKAQNYDKGEIYAYNILGRINRMRANYAKAIAYHNKAYDKALMVKDTNDIIYSLNMLGVVYRRMDAVKSALDYHYKALQIAQSVKNKNRETTKNIAISHNSIGNIYLLLQREDQAYKHFQKALNIETKFENKLGKAINYQNIGSILERRGKLDKALDYYNKSLAVNNEINSKVGKIICNTSISSVYLKKKELDKALQISKPSLALAKQLNDDYYLSDVYIHMGKVYNALQDYKQAEDYINKGLSIALDKKIPSEVAAAYEILANIKENQGNYKQAFIYHKKFTNEKNKIFNKKNRQIVSDVVINQLKLESNQKIKALDEQNQIVAEKLFFTKMYLYFIIAFVVLLMILGFIFYKQNQLNNQRAMMNMEQNLLRAQMNPHFIFNSLNSIKLYIIQNRQKDAVVYLSKFSKLIRAILDSTTQKEMSLHEEIETLKLYVSIENGRFLNEIDFTINVDENLPINEIEIPSLLTQPFIENALWHGLSPKKGEKKLVINIFPQDSKYFVIEIIDNGIGRERAMEIKKARTFKRTSIGIKLAKERLKEFSKRFKSSYELKFVDLKDVKNKPIGTKVIIKIPY